MLRQGRRASSLLALCQRQPDAIGACLGAAAESKVAHGAATFSSQAGSSRSLEFHRTPLPPAGDDSPGFLRSALLRLGGYYSKESTLMRAANGLYDAVAEAAGGDALLRALRVPDDFQHRHAVLALHVWLLLVRLRPEGADGKDLSQIFYDAFQDDLEHRVRGAGVKVKVRGQLAELEKQFYGSCVAYDKALQGEAAGGGGAAAETLAVALQRNVFQGAPGREADAARLERYVRRELASLSQTDSAAVLAGNVRFSFAAGVAPPP